jgi:eukaryotic-like serine/threonine-protein kinase
MSASESTAGPDLFNVLADEFAERHRRGERPPLSEYAEKYPELADQIRELFPALLAMEELGSKADQATGPYGIGAEFASPMPERLGDYRILREIARGGMGIVFEAVQESLGRHVALKVLPQYRLSDPSQLERFQREARAAAMLHHTNIVPVFGVGEHNGVHHYAMQYIQGQSLDAVLREVKRMREAEPAEAAAPSEPARKPGLAASVAMGLVSGQFADDCAAAPETVDSTALHSLRGPDGQDPVLTTVGLGPAPPASASSILGQSGSRYYRSSALIGAQAAEALAYAHHQKVLHRDIKPSNLLLDLGGTIWVTDFGLAKAEGTEALTQTGDIVGTLRYMAPERFRGVADARSDIYALGLTLYEMLTLEPVFAAEEKARLIEKILHEQPPSPRQLDSQIPRDLETIALKAMAREPSDRYQTASDLAEDLRRYLSDRPILARRASPFGQLRRWCRRNPLVAASLATMAAALLAFAALALLYANGQRRFGLEKSKSNQQITALAKHLETSLAESNRLLAVRNFDRGQAAFEKEQVGAGLLWMIEGWRAAVAARDPALQHAARANLSAWLPHQPRLIAVLSHPRPVQDAAFSPDGKIVVTGGDDGIARFWDAATGRSVGSNLVHPREVTSVAFSPDGQTILTGSIDGMARLWDARTGRPKGPILHHAGSGEVFVAISPDGKALLTGRTAAQGGEVRLSDAVTGQPVGPGVLNLGVPIAFSADGKQVLARGGPALLSDAATGRPIGPPLQSLSTIVRSAAISPDGKFLLIGFNDGAARLWCTATGQPLTPLLKGHDDRIRDVAFSPDGEFFLTGSTDKTARLWDALTGQPIGPPLQHQGPVVAVAFSPDGKSFLTTSSDSTVCIWGTDIDQPGGLVLEPRTACMAVAWGPDGTVILTGGFNGTARLWDARDGRPLSPLLQHAARIYDHAVAISPDGKIALTGSFDKTARMWAVPSGRAIGPALSHQGQVFAVAFTPDSKTIVTGSDDRMVRLWDTATGMLLGAPIPQLDAVNALAVSPDGKTFVAGYGLGVAQLWDLAARKSLGKPFPHPGSVETVAFSPDGRLVVTGCEDRTARVWDVATGALRLPPLATGSWIWSVDFSPDGKLIAAGNSDSVFLWDSVTGQPIGPTLRHPGSVYDLAFSPDSKTLLTGCMDGKARLFSRAPEVPDDLVRVANWVEACTGTALDPGQGSMRVLDNAAWLENRERLERLGGPLAPADADCADTPAALGELARRRSQSRVAKAQQLFSAALSASRGGRPDESIASFRWGLEIADRLVALFPGEREYQRMLAMAQNNFAWLLATYPDAKIQEPAQSVKLARMAVGLESKAGIYWNTLGVALYRTGDLRGAIEALRKSNELDAKSTLGFNAYFLAMAHSRQGEAARARAWFDIARGWHRRTAPANSELIRFRAEGAGVLGFSLEADPNEASAPNDDGALARLLLDVEPSASWARRWLERSRGNGTSHYGVPNGDPMPNGRKAFGEP